MANEENLIPFNERTESEQRQKMCIRDRVYGDKFIADNLRGTKASLDGVTLYLACTPSTKKFLQSSAVARCV